MEQSITCVLGGGFKLLTFPHLILSITSVHAFSLSVLV